jgi:hypothetical protein
MLEPTALTAAMAVDRISPGRAVRLIRNMKRL